MQLWALAERLNMPALQNGAIDRIEVRRGADEDIQLYLRVYEQRSDVAKVLGGYLRSSVGQFQT
jgi:hypothetical protein